MIEEMKKEFYNTFSDGYDEENGYYDAQFEGQTPYQVWSWFESKLKSEIAEVCKNMEIISVSTFEVVDIDDQIEQAEIRGYNNALRDLQKRFAPSPLDEVK